MVHQSCKKKHKTFISLPLSAKNSAQTVLPHAFFSPTYPPSCAAALNWRAIRWKHSLATRRCLTLALNTIPTNKKRRRKNTLWPHKNASGNHLARTQRPAARCGTTCFWHSFRWEATLCEAPVWGKEAGWTFNCQELLNIWSHLLCVVLIYGCSKTVRKNALYYFVSAWYKSIWLTWEMVWLALFKDIAL